MFGLYSIFPCVECKLRFPISAVSLVDILCITVTFRIVSKLRVLLERKFVLHKIEISWRKEYLFYVN